MTSYLTSNNLLCPYLGDGMLSFLQLQLERKGFKNKRLITKTPSVVNLEHFFKFFPKVKLVIIIRDGRAVVESMVRSFNFPYNWAIYEWNLGAESILNFEQIDDRPKDQYLIVKYEELCDYTEREMRKILQFLDLDETKFDFNAALKIPVRGSSTLRGADKTTITHTELVEKPADFNAKERWIEWAQAKHERFNWKSGSYMAEFGYEIKTYNNLRFFWKVYNILLDIVWELALIPIFKNILPIYERFFITKSGGRTNFGQMLLTRFILFQKDAKKKFAK